MFELLQEWAFLIPILVLTVVLFLWRRISDLQVRMSQMHENHMEHLVKDLKAVKESVQNLDNKFTRHLEYHLTVKDE